MRAVSILMHPYSLLFLRSLLSVARMRYRREPGTRAHSKRTGRATCSTCHGHREAAHLASVPGCSASSFIHVNSEEHLHLMGRRLAARRRPQLPLYVLCALESESVVLCRHGNMSTRAAVAAEAAAPQLLTLVCLFCRAGFHQSKLH